MRKMNNIELFGTSCNKKRIQDKHYKGLKSLSIGFKRYKQREINLENKVTKAVRPFHKFLGNIKKTPRKETIGYKILRLVKTSNKAPRIQKYNHEEHK